MSQDAELQSLYDEANKLGLFKADKELQGLAHQARALKLVSDPTQGGLVAPAPFPAALYGAWQQELVARSMPGRSLGPRAPASSPQYGAWQQELVARSMPGRSLGPRAPVDVPLTPTFARSMPGRSLGPRAPADVPLTPTQRAHEIAMQGLPIPEQMELWKQSRMARQVMAEIGPGSDAPSVKYTSQSREMREAIHAIEPPLSLNPMDYVSAAFSAGNAVANWFAMRAAAATPDVPERVEAGAAASLPLLEQLSYAAHSPSMLAAISPSRAQKLADKAKKEPTFGAAHAQQALWELASSVANPVTWTGLGVGGLAGRLLGAGITVQMARQGVDRISKGEVLESLPDLGFALLGTLHATRGVAPAVRKAARRFADEIRRPVMADFSQGVPGEPTALRLPAGPPEPPFARPSERQPEGPVPQIPAQLVVRQRRIPGAGAHISPHRDILAIRPKTTAIPQPFHPGYLARTPAPPGPLVGPEATTGYGPPTPPLGPGVLEHRGWLIGPPMGPQRWRRLTDPNGDEQGKAKTVEQAQMLIDAQMPPQEGEPRATVQTQPVGGAAAPDVRPGEGGQVGPGRGVGQGPGDQGGGREITQGAPGARPGEEVAPVEAAAQVPAEGQAAPEQVGPEAGRRWYYRATQRPPGMGSVPEGYEIHRGEGGDAWDFGTISYDHPLSANEMWTYSLLPEGRAPTNTPTTPLWARLHGESGISTDVREGFGGIGEAGWNKLAATQGEAPRPVAPRTFTPEEIDDLHTRVDAMPPEERTRTASELDAHRTARKAQMQAMADDCLKELLGKG